MNKTRTRVLTLIIEGPKTPHQVKRFSQWKRAANKRLEMQYAAEAAEAI